jgi:phytoene/squalene synthetase
MMLADLTRTELLTERKVKWHKRAFDVSEAIASKDSNNLYITSSFFKDSIKYRVFCAYYAVMRVVDDRVDNLIPPTHRGSELQKRELDIVEAWEGVVNLCSLGIHPTTQQLKACHLAESEALCESLIAAFQTFPIPVKLWTNFFKAMRSDIIASEFDRWIDFLNYAEGATVAPTTIYLHLIASHLNVAKNSYELPEGFDLLRCGRYLGIFAYLGHIMRDLAVDIKHVATRLCITREDMETHGVNPETLRKEALRCHASPATRELVIDILQRARRYLSKGRVLASQIQDFLDTDCRFILELIITIYEHIISKIESTGYNPMAKHHYLTWKEKAEVIHHVAARTGFSFPDNITI